MPKEKRITLHEHRAKHAPADLDLRTDIDEPLTGRDLPALGLPNKCFFTIICGRPGAGKTTLAVKLLATPDELYNGVFRHIYIISPSQHTLPESGLSLVPKKRRFEELNEQSLDAVWEDAKQTRGPHCLLIDDCGETLQEGTKKFKQRLERLIVRRRHVTKGGLSVFILAQTIVPQVPKKLRKLATNVIQCGQPSVEERRVLFDEYVQGELSRAQFADLLDRAIRNKHDWINIHACTLLKDMFYRKYNKLDVGVESSSESDEDSD